MVRNIYLVSQGAYSDYHIIGVFDDRKLADQFAEVNWADVEGPMELNPEFTYDPERLPWIVVIDKQKTIASRAPELEFEESSIYDWRSFVCRVRARDEEHAIKLASEKVQVLKARGITTYGIFQKYGNTKSIVHSIAPSTDRESLEKIAARHGKYFVDVYQITLPEDTNV